MNFADKLNPQPQAVRNPPFNGRWRLTECIGCPGALIHRALGCPAGQFDAHTLALFYEGVLHEKDLKQRIRDELEVTIVDIGDAGLQAPDAPIVVHPDGWMPELGEVLETKSIAEEMDSQDFIDSHPQYVKQVEGYLRVMNSPRARLIAKSRSTGWVFDDIIIDYDAAVTDPIWEIANRVKGLLDNGLQSCNGPWLPTCSPDFMTRMFCSYYGTHCKESPAQAVGELEDLLKNYAANKIVTDECVSATEALRQHVQALMENAGLDRVKSLDGISASLGNKREMPDMNAIRELIGEAQYKKFMVRPPGQQLRITIPKEMK